MAIEWNKVTKLSQIIAVVLGVIILALGFWLGMGYQKAQAPQEPEQGAVQGAVIGEATYLCAEGKSVRALYYEAMATLTLSDGRTLNLPHVISASGARYANEDESIVFWNKGTTAFMTEGGDKGSETTYADCAEAPLPQ